MGAATATGRATGRQIEPSKARAITTAQMMRRWDREKVLAGQVEGLRQGSDHLNRSVSAARSCAAISTFISAVVWWTGTNSGWMLPGLVAVICAAYATFAWWQRNDLRRNTHRVIGELREAGFQVDLDETGHGVRILDKLLDDYVLALDRSTLADEADLEIRLPVRPKSNPTCTFAWSPVDAGNLGAIALPGRPQTTLTADGYWRALARRIDDLIVAEGDSAAGLLREIERNEPLLNISGSVGLAMVRGSEWLRDRVRFPAEGVPVCNLEHDPELFNFLADEDTLERYIWRLYNER